MSVRSCTNQDAHKSPALRAPTALGAITLVLDASGVPSPSQPCVQVTTGALTGHQISSATELFWLRALTEGAR